MRMRLLIKAETELPPADIEALIERLKGHLEAEQLEAIVFAVTDNDDPPELWTQNPQVPG